MAQINIRMDDNLKNDAEQLFDSLGLNMSTAFNIFVRQALREGGIPFRIVDPFYSESNMQSLKKAIHAADEGKLIERDITED